MCDLSWKTMGFVQVRVPAHGFKSHTEVHSFSMSNLTKSLPSMNLQLCGELNWHKNFVVVQSLSHVQLFVICWIPAGQISPSFTISQSLLKLMSIESVMPSNHLVLCCFLFLLPSTFPSIRVSSSSLHQVAKVLELRLQHQFFQWTFRIDFL